MLKKMRDLPKRILMCWFYLFLLAATLIDPRLGYGFGKSVIPKGDPLVLTPINLVLDPRLDPEDRDTLEAIIKLLSETKIELKSDHPLYKAFGDSNGRIDLGDWLNQRIKWIVPREANVLENLHGDNLPKMRNIEGSVDGVAENLGGSLFLRIVARYKRYDLFFLAGGKKIPLQSPRVGIVQLGGKFKLPVSSEDEFSKRTKLWRRATVLIHEARHSDCTGGLRRSVFNRFAKGALDNDILARESYCTHQHIDCPVGHPLVGQAGCDLHASGAYGIEAIFADGLARGCTTCSKEEKYMLAQLAEKSASRLVLEDARVQLEEENLDPHGRGKILLRFILRGEMGIPDMSSQDIIEDQ